eukprot:UN27172
MKYYVAFPQLYEHFCFKNTLNMCDRLMSKNLVYDVVPLNNCLSPQRGKQLFTHSMVLFTPSNLLFYSQIFSAGKNKNRIHPLKFINPLDLTKKKVERQSCPSLLD